ncbi:hypothetical protein [Haloarcula argentinensis]|uniref:Uncharacterized protein n=1 Tax=Haloarcula argentinensis TaxID=43776 RepID=A0ABU2F636_HALAR|nr:hypothetical protein [Haloarcula argentinensis]MDS0256027.1 hypothetical protein [Haloarcula argentinensis]
MTFNETHIEFEASIAELEAEIEELADELEGLDEDNPLYPQKAQRRADLATQRKGAVWACPGRGEDADVHEDDDFPMWNEPVDGVTLGAVRAGAMDSITSEVVDNGGEGSEILLVADGSVKAPYVGDDMTDKQEAGAVGDLHPWYREWCAARINELLDPESGNEKHSSGSPKET